MGGEGRSFALLCRCNLCAPDRAGGASQRRYVCAQCHPKDQLRPLTVTGGNEWIHGVHPVQPVGSPSKRNVSKATLRLYVDAIIGPGSFAHTTILRWVQRYAPEFIKRRNRFARPAGRSWRVDETSSSRQSSMRGSRQIRSHSTAMRLRIALFARCVRTVGYSKRTKLRSSKYLNNLIDQDHRGVKSRVRPMLGFKNFQSAAITIAGVELLRRIHKNQFALSRLRIKGQASPRSGMPCSPRKSQTITLPPYRDIRSVVADRTRTAGCSMQAPCSERMWDRCLKVFSSAIILNLARLMFRVLI
jgi:hypothetical protein